LTDEDRKDSESQNPPREPSGASVNLNISGRVVLDLPKPPSVKHEHSNQQATYRQDLKDNLSLQLRKVRFLAEILTLIVLSIYTGINYCLYKTTKDTEQVTERAYVNVQQVRLAHPFAIGATAEALIDYGNSGLTPAKELWIATSVAFSDNGKISADVERQGACHTVPNGEVLPPKVIRHVSTDTARRSGLSVPPEFKFRVKADRYADVIASRTRWYVGASISYRDQFGRCHHTYELFFYNPQTSEFDPSFIGWKQTDK